MSQPTLRRTRKGFLLLTALLLVTLAGSTRTARADCDFVVCPFYMTSDCHGSCYCDCPIDPSGDPYDWGNCGPCS
jgi:hypothetical protein